jgi:hypothetical protein
MRLLHPIAAPGGIRRPGAMSPDTGSFRQPLKWFGAARPGPSKRGKGHVWENSGSMSRE